MPKQSGYQYSYSGADCKIYAYLQGAEENVIPIESMNTISVSVHESKGQVRALGHRGIKGVSRGLRTIAGSMVLTVIEDHPLRELLVATQTVPTAWSLDKNDKGIGTFNSKVNFSNRIETLLPPFNILAMYASELHSNLEAPLPGQEFSPQTAGWSLEGVHIIDVGLVTSVHDIVSEMTISFIAEDYYPISLNNLEITGEPASIDLSATTNNERAVVDVSEQEREFYEYLFDYSDLDSPSSVSSPAGNLSTGFDPY
jgi:hypothetical protein